MKEDKWLESSRICLAYGHSVAKNHMFETKQDQELFLELWHRYLGGMTEIMNYCLSDSGWVVMFKTKADSDIHQAYSKQRRRSKKAKSRCVLTQTTKMLSEHFRIFLSQYARRMNALNRRKGTLVLERFKKILFEKYEDVLREYDRISQGILDEVQSLKKYRTKKRRLKSRIMVKMRRTQARKYGQVYDGGKCVRAYWAGVVWRFLSVGGEDFNSVLRKFGLSTKHTLQPKIPPENRLLF